MKKNLFKKWVAMLGTISLLTIVFMPGLDTFAAEDPAYVASIGNKKYTTLEEASNDVLDWETITLIRDIIEKASLYNTWASVGSETRFVVSSEKSNLKYSLDLGWHTITCTEAHCITVRNNNELTIKDSSNNWKIQSDHDQIIDLRDGWKLIIESWEISTTSDYVIAMFKDTSLVVKWWKLTASWPVISWNWSWCPSWWCTFWDTDMKIIWWEITSNNDYVIYHPASETLLISWDVVVQWNAWAVAMNYWKIVVNSWTLISNNVDNSWTVWSNWTAWHKASVIDLLSRYWDTSAEINWWRFVWNTLFWTWTDSESNWHKPQSVIVKWWTFSVNVPSEYLSSDADIIVTDAEAEIWKIQYKTLADAIQAAKDGDTITLLKDIEIKWESSSDVSLKIENKNIVIDWADNTIKYDNKPVFVSNWANYLFKIYGSTVTLNDMKITNSLWAIIVWEDSKVTLNNVDLDWNDWYWIDTKVWLLSLELNNVTRTDGLVVNNDCKKELENGCEIEPLWNKLSWKTLLTWVKAGDKSWYVKYIYVPVYTIKFVSDDWKNIISEKQYAYWTLAADITPSTNPSKAADSLYTYTFNKWTPDVVNVTTWAIYTATYNRTAKSSWGSSSGGGSTGWSSSSSSSSKTTTTNNTWSTNTWTNANSTTSNTEEINLGWEVSEESTSTSEETSTPDNGYSKEFNDAYTWAFKNGITTMSPIEKADMNAPLTRIAMAKMLSQYAINVLGRTPDTTKVVPAFPDVSAELDAAYNSWVTLAYQLGIMWINIDKFRPDDLVTRAEFGTALSRMLYATADWEKTYYETHLAKLMEEKIITVDTPDMQELRWYVMIMLMRSANK